jgi:hypothetical protein
MVVALSGQAQAMRSTGGPVVESTSLSGNHLAVCRQSEAALKQRVQRATDRISQQLAFVTAVAARTELFAAAQQRTSAAYLAAAAAVHGAQDEAIRGVGGLKNYQFACDSTNPKGQVGTIKTSLKLATDQLRAYRTAVQGLITVVRATPVVSPTTSPRLP